jgi:hypothetical protein
MARDWSPDASATGRDPSPFGPCWVRDNTVINGHEGDHHKQQGVRSGAVGDLVAITHGHEQAA